MLLREWRTGSDYDLRTKTVSAQEIRQQRCRNKPRSSWEKEGKWTRIETYQWLGHKLPPLARDPTWEASFLLQRSAINRLKLLPPIPRRDTRARVRGGSETRSSASLRENKERRRAPLCMSVSIGFPGPNPNSLNVRLCKKIRVSNPTLLAFVKISISQPQNSCE
jgi:hypothetical protein